MSSQSERFSDDQCNVLKVSPSHYPQSPEVTSKAIDAESTVRETNQTVEHLKQELLDACSPGLDPQLKDSTLKSQDTQITVEESIGSAEHLINSAADASTSDCPKPSSVEDGSPKQETKSEEVPFRSMVVEKEDTETVKLLTDKLSAALLNVSQKDDLVKQHAKVAEEAVAGWEKAENEATALKQQLEIAVQQKSTMEARIFHLDEALKECVRQLRLARDEQERKIREALAEKIHDWEIIKSKLEGQIFQLQAQVESSTANAPGPALQYKLEYLETENVALKRELQLHVEELEVRTIERDLSTKAAETASKQHLESIKKVAKLEAECRRLKALPRTASSSYDHKSAAASSCVESVTDALSDNADQLNASEVDSRNMNVLAWNQFKNEKAVGRTVGSSSVKIDLMDDFLEMEKLAALPEAVAKATSNSESQLKNELKGMIQQTMDLEETIETLEAEKTEMERALAQTQYCLEESQVQLVEAQMKLEQLEWKLQEMNELKMFHESQTSCLNADGQLMSNKIHSLTEEIERERAVSAEISSKCKELQVELRRKKQEFEEVQCGAVSNEEMMLKAVALAESQDSLQKSETKLKEAEGKLQQLETQIVEAYELKGTLELELTSSRAEAQTMSTQIDLLQAQVEKEQALSAKLATECRNLENELECKRQELDLQKKAHSKSEVKIKQEELAVAAGKLEECQRTIASLGSQLSSLATLEDFLIDTASIPGFSAAASLIPRDGGEPWRFHSNGTFMHKKEPPCFNHSREAFIPDTYNDEEESRASSSLSTSSAFLLSHPTSGRSENSFGKLFSPIRN